jgi:Fe2+ transport system protein FeoA
VQRVSEVAEHDAPELLRELDSYGLVTGARITVAGADRSVQAVPVEVGGKTRPIGTGVARLIWVEPEPSTLLMQKGRTNTNRRAATSQRRSSR